MRMIFNAGKLCVNQALLQRWVLRAATSDRR